MGRRPSADRAIPGRPDNGSPEPVPIGFRDATTWSGLPTVGVRPKPLAALQLLAIFLPANAFS